MGALRLALDCTLTPGDVLRAVRDEDRPFCLVGRWAGSQAIVGFGPSRVVHDAFPPDEPPAAGGGPSPVPPVAHGGPPPAPPVAGGGPLPSSPQPFVGGGWFGFLGFALGGQVERLPPPPPRPVATPAAELGWYDSVLRLDADGTWWFEALADDDAACDRLSHVRDLLARPVAPRPWSLDGMTLRDGASHLAAVAECVERIAAGELFQANLCVRLDGRLRGNPADAFADAAPRLEPAYGAFVGRPGGAVLSFSPELFLRRRGREVETGPIKGTAPRVPGTADAAREELAASAKDAAEHVMIVDLMRNDLGRVAAYGTVHADDRPVVEAHPGVWHLVSRVRAELRHGVGDEELLRATFPPGSVTGAPKVQALKVIHALESTAREVYTGAVGMISPHAGLELNVAIRTLEVRGDRAWLGCGGGIVADSSPEAELREALAKARPIVEALGGTVPRATRPASGGVAGSPGRAAFSTATAPRLERPDPARGAFETLAVRDGRPVALHRHLARLEASAAEALGSTLPADLAERATAIAADVGEGVHRLRIVATPDGRVDMTIARAFGGPPADVALHPVVLPGGLGAHKWADRRPLDGIDTALVLDLDGTVLEAGSANVWLVEGDRLVTPPADGRILPGVTRDRVLATGAFAVDLEAFGLDRLGAADGVVVTSSIRIAAPAALAGTEPTQRAREVAEAIRAELTPVAAVA